MAGSSSSYRCGRHGEKDTVRRTGGKAEKAYRAAHGRQGGKSIPRGLQAALQRLRLPLSSFAVEKEGNEHQQRHGKAAGDAQADVAPEGVRYGAHGGGTRGTADVARQRQQGEQRRSALGEGGGGERKGARPHDADGKADHAAADQSQKGKRGGRKGAQGVPRRAHRRSQAQRRAQAQLCAKQGKEQAREPHKQCKHTRAEQIAQRFGNMQARLCKRRRPLADRLLTAARAEHEHEQQPKYARRQQLPHLHALPFLYQREEGHEQEIDGVAQRHRRPDICQHMPAADARRPKEERRQGDDGDLPPTVKGVQHAHRRLFVLARARLDGGADQHFDQPAAHGVDGGGDEQPRRRQGQKARQKGEHAQPRRREQVRRHHAGAVTELIDDLGRDEVDQQLHAEIDGDQGADDGQRQGKLFLKGQKQQRSEVVDDRLGDIADITGGDGVPRPELVHFSSPSASSLTIWQ